MRQWESIEIPEVNGGVSGQLSEKKGSSFPASHVCPRDPEGVSKCWNPIPSHGQVHGPLVAFFDGRIRHKLRETPHSHCLIWLVIWNIFSTYWD